MNKFVFTLLILGLYSCKSDSPVINAGLYSENVQVGFDAGIKYCSMYFEDCAYFGAATIYESKINIIYYQPGDLINRNYATGEIEGDVIRFNHEGNLPPCLKKIKEISLIEENNWSQIQAVKTNLAKTYLDPAFQEASNILKSAGDLVYVSKTTMKFVEIIMNGSYYYMRHADLHRHP